MQISNQTLVDVAMAALEQVGALAEGLSEAATLRACEALSEAFSTMGGPGRELLVLAVEKPEMDAESAPLVVLDTRPVGGEHISLSNGTGVVARIANTVSGRPLADVDLDNAKRLAASTNILASVPLDKLVQLGCVAENQG